jgi:hypothetical protein
MKTMNTLSKGSKNLVNLQVAVNKQKLIRKIEHLFGEVKTTLTASRTSIFNLGKALSGLQSLAKRHRVPFRPYVQENLTIPVRTVYHYIGLYESANGLKSSVTRKVIAAGFDPAQPRILEKLSSLGARVDKMTLASLAEKLEKGASPARRTPLQRVRRAIREASKALLDYATVNDMSYSDARSAALEVIEAALSRLKPKAMKRAA